MKKKGMGARGIVLIVILVVAIVGAYYASQSGSFPSGAAVFGISDITCGNALDQVLVRDRLTINHIQLINACSYEGIQKYSLTLESEVEISCSEVDLDGDESVSKTDLEMFLDTWRNDENDKPDDRKSSIDYNDDEIIGSDDLVIFLGSWGCGS